MSDHMYGERGRRRRRRGVRRDYDDDYYHSSHSPAQPQSRTPIILAKPPDRPASRGSPSLSEDLATSPRSGEAASSDHTDTNKPAMVMLRGREDSTGGQFHSSPSQSIPNMLAGDVLQSQVYQLQRRVSNPTANPNLPSAERFGLMPEMTRSVKLVNNDLTWSEAGTEWLLDQTDFLVVGMLGMQSSGKSLIASHLVSSPTESCKTVPIEVPHTSGGVFATQSRETELTCSHETQGIDMYVTPDRTVYLDTQPVLSTSVLDQLIRHEYKYPAEFTSTENCIEMQSLQLASFLLTVCHVVVIVLDGFADLTNFRFIQTAEMLKPATPPPHDATSDLTSEYYPHIVFAVNRASRENMTADGYLTIQKTIHRLMQGSKLKFKGTCNMSRGRLIAGLTHDPLDINTFLIPDNSNSRNTDNKGGIMSFLPDYRGHSGFESIMESLSEQILSVPRRLLTHTTLSEKNWFHYAARTWEGVKKSNLFAEYNRLLP